MLVYNLLECSRELVELYRFEVNNDAIENNDASNYGIKNNKTITIKILEYKTKIIGNISGNNSTLDTEVAVSFKYLTKYLKFFNLTLINS